MKKIVIFSILLAMISKISGLIKYSVFSYFYGMSPISDAYVIATTIPVTIFSFIGVAISTGYIPMKSKIDIKYGEKEGILFTNNFINVVLLFSFILIIFLEIFVGGIIELFASGFNEQTFDLAKKMTRITLLGLFFPGLIYILNSFLQLKGKYLITIVAGIILNVVIIISIFFSSHDENYLILGLGVVISFMVQFVIILLISSRNGYRHSKILNIKDSSLITMFVSVLPAIFGISINQINILIDKRIASEIIIGGISVLNYSSRVNELIHGVLIISTSTIMFPILSKLYSNNDNIGFKNKLRESIGLILILIVPATVGVLFFSPQIISFLFGRGAFDTSAIDLSSTALYFYSFGMIGTGLREIFSRAFYSMQDTRTPMINAALGMLLNIILNIILSRIMGIGGLALATSISATFTTMLLFISLRKKIGSFGMKQVTISFLKVVFASLIMSMVAKYIFNYLATSLSQNVSLLGAIAVGVVSYIVIIYFMKIEDVDVLVRAIKKKLDTRII